MASRPDLLRTLISDRLPLGLRSACPAQERFVRPHPRSRDGLSGPTEPELDTLDSRWGRSLSQRARSARLAAR